MPRNSAADCTATFSSHFCEHAAETCGGHAPFRRKPPSVRIRTQFQLKDARSERYSLLDGAAKVLIGGVAESLRDRAPKTVGTHSCLPEPDLPHLQAEITVLSDSSGLAAVEADHRVANSLSLAAALLRMQRKRSTDPTVGEAILSAEARVASIARFHAYLHRHGARDRIDLAE
jgi:two-component sensor histidine kinase